MTFQHHSRSLRSAFFISAALFLWALACIPAHAQLQVGIQIKRSVFMLHEPVIATVTVTNNAGRDVMLDETEDGGQWFSFQITNSESKVIPPRNLNYQLEPLQIPAGQTVKRTVNLNELYMLDDYGLYKVRASIYFPPMKKFFSSKYLPMNLTEGKKIWQRTVGVPGNESAYRNFVLLTMEHDKGMSLYVRIEGQDDGAIYGCYDLGPLVAEVQPDIQFDSGNNLWILQLVGQKTFFLSRIGINGDFQGQSTYVTPKNIPRLRKLADGTLQLVGAYKQDRVAQQGPVEEAPRLSARPAGLPR